MLLTRYLQNLSIGRIILWCYFIWWVVSIIHHFDALQRIWVTSLGLMRHHRRGADFEHTVCGEFCVENGPVGGVSPVSCAILRLQLRSAGDRPPHTPSPRHVQGQLDLGPQKQFRFRSTRLKPNPPLRPRFIPRVLCLRLLHLCHLAPQH